MTLQEKFENAPIVYDEELNFIKNYESIADDFAIGFFNWAKSYQANDRNNWSLATKELLQIYKKL